MTVQELCARFPEIPEDIRGEAILARYAETFDQLLENARAPSACATAHDAANHYYSKLVGPMAIYGYGLATRDGLLAEMAALLERHAHDPEVFATSLLPAGTADKEQRGPGCS